MEIVRKSRFNRGGWKNEKEGMKSKGDSFFSSFCEKRIVVRFACNYRFYRIKFLLYSNLSGKFDLISWKAHLNRSLSC